MSIMLLSGLPGGDGSEVECTDRRNSDSFACRQTIGADERGQVQRLKIKDKTRVARAGEGMNSSCE